MNEIINQIKKIIDVRPEKCIVLGSGLDNFINELENTKILDYDQILGFPKTNVDGHAGQFVFGYLNNIPVLCAKGRFHHYEGHSFEDVGIIIKIFNFFNPNKILITNSCGCLRLDWELGNFMIVEKFLDFSFISKNIPIYFELNNNLKKNYNIYKGCYTYTIGPTYETKSEIDEIINLGGDAVGMSTFPEYLMCKKLNIEPIIICCLTNYGAGLKKEKIDHKDVLINANKSKKKFNQLIIDIIQNT